MRRVELIRAVRTVLAALKESRVHEALAQVARTAGDQPARHALLSALREYTVRSAAFGPAEQRVVEALDLAPLDDPAWWVTVVSGGAGEGGKPAAAMLQTIRVAGASLPKLLNLLSNEAIQRGTLPPERQPQDGMQQLEVIVIESEHQQSSPVRLITALESVWLLYDAVTQMQKLPANTLSVVSCDSGSDKAFYFLGLSPAIKGVRDILLSVWDRVVFYRGRQAEARMAMIEQSLPALERIVSLRQRELIGPEEAEILRRRVVAGVKKFLEAGCTLPEIEDTDRDRARALLTPSPKLLANPTRRPTGP
ncbi:MAG TPA: hypothetical protein VFH27_07440 [Longimicrobiaceae bacterium]|nr:hypothetical protein [Longimicrobiaceae bacterium]